MESKNYMKKIKEVQDVLRKDSLQKYYQSTILGMTILKRLCQEFEPKRVLIKKKYDEMEKNGDINTEELMSLSGMGYYNVSGLSFNDLVKDEQKIYDNIKTLIDSFSSNITSIFEKKGLDLINTCSAINDKKSLADVVKKYNKMDFSKNAMSNADMGALFSELVVMVYGTPENGENWTPTDFVELLTNLLLAEDCEYLQHGFNRISLLDNAVGSGQLTSYFEKLVTDKSRFKGENEVVVCGQDNSDLNIAVCKAEQIMLGQKPDNFRVGDTLKEDMFPNMQFDFLIQNAPYGCGRKKTDEKEIKKLLGDSLPTSNDNQMLFWKAGIRKLKFGARGAFLSNGSPLFSGSTLSGESMIRKWLFDNDYVEAIIKLTDQGFLDTDISIYAWIINKGNKSNRRKKIIQVIDASSFYHTLRKGVGKKKKEITDEDIKKIVNLYKSFPNENEFVKNMTKEDFYFKEVTIMQPYQRNYKISIDRIDNLYNQTSFKSLFDEEKYDKLFDEIATVDVLEEIKIQEEGRKLQKNIISKLNKNISDEIYINEDKFKKHIKLIFPDLETKYITAIVKALSEKDKTSDVYKDKKSKSGLRGDSELKDKEFVPLLKDVDEYFREEVLPYLKDSWYLDDYEDKIGCKINFNKYFYKPIEHENTNNLVDKIKELAVNEDKLMEAIFNE